jgi:hypothetical protein
VSGYRTYPVERLGVLVWKSCESKDVVDGGVLRKSIWEPKAMIVSQAMQRNMLSDPVAKAKQ